MAIYITIYCLIAGSVFLSRAKHKGKVAFFLFLLFFVVLAFRHPSMGVDLQYMQPNGYLGMFEKISNESWSSVFNKDFAHYEIGYVLFCKFISIFSNDGQWLLACCSFFSLLPIFYVYYKYSESLQFSLIIYLALNCFYICFSGLRQGCAIGICVASYPFIVKRKPLAFILIVLISSLFHSSSIVFLLSYPLYWIRIKQKYRPLTLLLIFIIFLFRFQLFRFISPLLGYELNSRDTGAYMFFLFFVAIYLILTIFSKIDSDTELNGLMNIFLLLIITQCFNSVHMFVGRVGFYFMPFLCLLIPKSIKRMNRDIRPIAISGFVTFFTIYGLFCIYSTANSWAQAYPWIPFWYGK